jgi:hypothetical protein
MSRRTPPRIARRSRIVDIDQCDDLDLLEPPHLTVSGKDSGEIVFVAVEEDRTPLFRVHVVSCELIRARYRECPFYSLPLALPGDPLAFLAPDLPERPP